MSAPTPDLRRRGRLTGAELDVIETLAARGLSAGQIARRLNRIPATVNFAMHSLGLKAPAARQAVYVRAGRIVRTFAAEEDAFIAALRTGGLTTPQIAARTSERFGHPRTAATVLVRLRMLANLEHRS